VETDRKHREPDRQAGPLGTLRTWLNVMSLSLWGLGVAAAFGSVLVAKRMPHFAWQAVLELVFLGCLTAPLLYEDSIEGPSLKPSNAGCLARLALLACLAALYPMRTLDWAPVAAGASFGAYFWVSAKSAGRSYLILPAGCVLAGVSALQAPWPNEQRCLLALVGVGLAGFLQGTSNIIQYLRGRQPAQPH
jgi:FtsH-binding integral membrane protein